VVLPLKRKYSEKPMVLKMEEKELIRKLVIVQGLS